MRTLCDVCGEEQDETFTCNECKCQICVDCGDSAEGICYECADGMTE